ncbi:MAG: hypothetical protein AAF724_09695 [Pseudomonadota bacterium]
MNIEHISVPVPDIDAACFHRFRLSGRELALALQHIRSSQSGQMRLPDLPGFSNETEGSVGCGYSLSAIATLWARPIR